MNIKKLMGKAGVVVGGVVAASSAMAQTASATADVAGLASSVSFSDVGLAILAIAGALISLAVIKKGAMAVIHMVGGNR